MYTQLRRSQARNNCCYASRPSSTEWISKCHLRFVARHCSYSKFEHSVFHGESTISTATEMGSRLRLLTDRKAHAMPPARFIYHDTLPEPKRLSGEMLMTRARLACSGSTILSVLVERSKALTLIDEAVNGSQATRIVQTANGLLSFKCLMGDIRRFSHQTYDPFFFLIHEPS